MSHVSVFRLWLKRALAYFTLRRTLVRAGLFFYCLVLFLAFDFAYSNLTRGEEKQRPARIANAIYDHGLAANFDGYDVWGEVRYRLITDSLGFKDASVREVALKSASRRILLIGDSFTEGIGVSIEDSMPASHHTLRASTTRRSSIFSMADYSSTRSYCSPIPPM
jgi:hypothetical protein